MGGSNTLLQDFTAVNTNVCYVFSWDGKDCVSLLLILNLIYFVMYCPVMGYEIFLFFYFNNSAGVFIQVLLW